MHKTNIANYILTDLSGELNFLNNYEYDSKMIDAVVEHWSKKQYISPKIYIKQSLIPDNNKSHLI